ncbi:MAG: hypothetical protein U0Q16_00620 [Bryobacteraceae bacterium]
MRLLASLVLVSVQAAAVSRFHVASTDPGPWPRILSSLGFVPGAGGVYVINEPPADVAAWRQRIDEGATVILEGESGLAASLGIRPKPGRQVPVRSLVDVHNPGLAIVWSRAVPLPLFELPASAKVFASEKWTGAPVAAGVRQGKGAVLWVAVHPGTQGYERFPYLAQALADLGVEPPLRSRHLWAFFDWSYRSRADSDFLAARWRAAGISALHVAAWHFHEPDPARDLYLTRLIEACHRQAIAVYAWVELPHVSEKFWADHPEWREKTAIGQDAHLDWRRLMNLQDPACARAVAAGLEQLVTRFDWDGINLAELYFESLEGHANAARFTPMNQAVRTEFQGAHGFDPLELFDAASPRYHAKDARSLRTLLDWRAALAQRLQEHWLGELERIRRRKPDLDLVLTHVDDRYDTRMRDSIGADAGRLLGQLSRRDFTFLVEDPATLWDLGPERYRDIAAKYQPITPKPNKLAVDINIVERYQDVYPTKQQTGLELFQLVHHAAQAFPRVALYFENSLLPADLPWLGSAAAAAKRVDRVGEKLVVESDRALGVPWKGPARVDGRPWPWRDDRVLWLPAGGHSVEAAAADPPLRLLDFNGTLQSLAAGGAGLELAYTSEGAAWAVFDHALSRVEIDGEAASPRVEAVGSRRVMRLPRGQHLVTVSAR